MPRKPDERIIQAKELYLKGLKLVEIASQLSLPEGTVRRWKSTYKWDNERSDKNSERSDKKKGGQPSNKNGKYYVKIRAWYGNYPGRWSNVLVFAEK